MQTLLDLITSPGSKPVPHSSSSRFLPSPASSSSPPVISASGFELSWSINPFGVKSTCNRHPSSSEHQFCAISQWFTLSWITFFTGVLPESPNLFFRPFSLFSSPLLAHPLPAVARRSSVHVCIHRPGRLSSSRFQLSVYWVLNSST